MKRFHLFELEDFAWFPHGLRVRMTRFIVALHRLMRTPESIAPLLERALARTETQEVTDLCSGSCGPMLQVMPRVWARPGLDQVRLTLTDLFPQLGEAKDVAARGDARLRYLTTPVDATSPGEHARGVRTMMCSLHHMPPPLARKILADAHRAKAPFLAYEISDNSLPTALWWLAIPNNFVLTLLLTPWIRPMTWQQLALTYVVPVLPACVAWDGAVSNGRTYTPDDLRELLAGLESDDYTWEIGKTGGFGPARQLYLLGLPKAA